MRRGWLLVLCCLVALAVSAPVRVGAAPDHPEGGGEATPGAGAGKDEHKDEGVFSGALDLTIWTIVVFLLLLFVLSRYAWKPMLQGLEKREKDIHAAVDEARKAKEEAHQIRTQLEQERQKGYDEVRGMIEDARKEAEQLKERRKAEAEAEIAADRERLRRELALARDQALQEMWRQAADLATLVSSKVLRRQLNAEDHRNLLDEALQELPGAVEVRRRALGSEQPT